MENALILKVENHHFDGCGEPPVIDPEKGRVAYFQNEFGEQIIMQLERDTKICRVWHGDVGWEEELRVEELRGEPIIVFARSKEERNKEFKMNTQFDHRELLKDTNDDFGEKILKEMRKQVSKQWKPKLTDNECDRVLHTPTLSQEERRTIHAIYNIWTR